MFNPFRRAMSPLVPKTPPRTRYHAQLSMAQEGLASLPSEVWAEAVKRSSIGQHPASVRALAQYLDRYADELERIAK